MNPATIPMIDTEEDIVLLSSKVKTYKVYQVFELPIISSITNDAGQLIVSKVDFLQQCLNQVLQRNQDNMITGKQRSNEYFTSLNHAERYRIPVTIRRFNNIFGEQQYGILGFTVLRGENAKNKVYNQRISSINPALLSLERICEVIYPTSYQLTHPIDLSALGRVIDVSQEGFYVVRIREA